MKRRSFLSALAALPFLPKLFGKQKEALTGESAEPKFVPQATRVSPRRRYYNPDDMPSTSGTYSDAVTYRKYVRIRDEKYRRGGEARCRYVDAYLLDIPIEPQMRKPFTPPWSDTPDADFFHPEPSEPLG